MHLKDKRFDCDVCGDDWYGYSPSKLHCKLGSEISCDDVVSYINHQKQQFGMTAEKILEKIARKAPVCD